MTKTILLALHYLYRRICAALELYVCKKRKKKLIHIAFFKFLFKYENLRKPDRVCTGDYLDPCTHRSRELKYLYEFIHK